MCVCGPAPVTLYGVVLCMVQVVWVARFVFDYSPYLLMTVLGGIKLAVGLWRNTKAPHSSAGVSDKVCIMFSLVARRMVWVAV